jgi:hypothetical protein
MHFLPDPGMFDYCQSVESLAPAVTPVVLRGVTHQFLATKAMKSSLLPHRRLSTFRAPCG